jgi:hypothetical protein
MCLNFQIKYSIIIFQLAVTYKVPFYQCSQLNQEGKKHKIIKNT